MNWIDRRKYFCIKANYWIQICHYNQVYSTKSTYFVSFGGYILSTFTMIVNGIVDVPFLNSCTKSLLKRNWCPRNLFKEIFLRIYVHCIHEKCILMIVENILLLGTRSNNPLKWLIFPSFYLIMQLIVRLPIENTGTIYF